MYRRCLFVICLCLSVCFGFQSASASIINGDFLSDLNSWTAVPADNVDWDNGEAVISTGDHQIYDTWLSQGIVISPSAYLFSFDFRFSTVDDNQDASDDFSFSDWFQASYGDSFNLTFSRNFMAYDSSGPYDPDTFDPISLIDLGTGMFRFQTLITDLKGRSGTLYFDLFDENDGKATTVNIDNVQILERQGNPVPEPGTLLLLSAGLACLAGMRVRHKKNLQA